MRSILPALKDFSFDGILEYLEDLVNRVGGGGGGASQSVRDSGISNPRKSFSRLDNAEREATIASGEMFPE
jgi:hypothetical protein